MSVHAPVLLDECLSWLDPQPGGHFIDCTVDGAGHSTAILERTAPTGELLGLDADPGALAVARARLAPFGPRAHLIHANFRRLGEVAGREGFSGVDGVLMDLGLSSPQLEASGRGFSFGRDEPLDMRFDPTTGQTAADLIAASDREDLERIIHAYGEEPRAGAIASRIAAARASGPIATTGQLVSLIFRSSVRRASVRRGRQIHPATRTFQALRIAVNDELGALAEALPQAIETLRRGGRLAVISFHSLEDRIVKNFLRRRAGLAIDVTDRRLPITPAPSAPDVRILTKHPLTRSEEELARNPRSRSARLRVAERI